MPEYTVTVRTALMPLYYKNFHCLMGACQDTCCAGWEICFHKKDYLKVKRAVQGTQLEQAAAQGVRRLRDGEKMDRYAEMSTSELGHCFFQTEEGLCSLQLTCGETALPGVCRSFPRGEHYTLAAKEFSLTPACEGVLALLWDLPDGIDFWEEPLERKDWKFYKADNPAAARFGDIRSFCIDILQERSLKLSQRMLLLGFVLQQIRDADWEAEDTVDAWLERGEKLLHNPATAAELDQLPGNRDMFIANNHRVITAAILTHTSSTALAQELWYAILAEADESSGNQFVFRKEHYAELEAQLEELLGHSEYFFENLMVSIFFYLGQPALSSPEKLWQGYVNLCNLYSVYRFAAVCGCEKEVSRKRLFHVLVGISRMLLHNDTRRHQLRDELFQNGSATLAHMAILLGG